MRTVNTGCEPLRISEGGKAERGGVKQLRGGKGQRVSTIPRAQAPLDNAHERGQFKITPQCEQTDPAGRDSET